MFRKIKEAPLNYWEEKSFMLIIPPILDKNILDNGIKRISEIKGVKIKDTNLSVEKGILNLVIVYENEEYEVCFHLGNISVSSYYLNSGFYFSDKERKDLLNANVAVTIFMKFSKDYLKSYHLQLKLAVAMVPDLIGVMDESAEKMLPAKWVLMAAKSEVLPNPKNLFIVQAVRGKNDKVWLHTHGLCRCGISELEILDSDANHYQNHYHLITTYALYLLDKKDKISDLEEGAYIGCLINGKQVVATNRPWTEGILEYKHLKLGNLKDRANGHNSKSNIIFLYENEEDEKNKVLRKVSIYDSLWGDNPLFFFSDEETFRMKKLAMERFHYVKKAFESSKNTILIKIGLPLEEEGKFEHIWFELIEIKGNKFKGKLTQEPYQVEGVHTGDERWFTKDDVTDWIVYTEKFSVNPDNAYLLEE